LPGEEGGLRGLRRCAAGLNAERSGSSCRRKNERKNAKTSENTEKKRNMETATKRS